VAETAFFWLVLLNVLINFIHGVLLPVIPHLNLASAGLAFTAFSLFKVLSLAPAGMLGDRIGHWRCLTLALLFQLSGLAIMYFYPLATWEARILEGLALAQGTVSTISLCRLFSPQQAKFSKMISILIGFGGLGFIAGPILGYGLLARGNDFVLGFLMACCVGFLVLQLASHYFYPAAILVDSNIKVAFSKSKNQEAKTTTMIGLSAAKAVGVGWLPNMAWWATNDVHLTPFLSGISFVLLGAGFAVGALKPVKAILPLGLVGLLSLEISLHFGSAWWWPALAILGFWYGSCVSLAMAHLGWNKKENIGQYNSKWMILTDLPMALTPVLLWSMKEPEFQFARVLLGVFIVLVAIGGLWRGVPRQFQKYHLAEMENR